jgi:hypothetical protein
MLSSRLPVRFAVILAAGAALGGCHYASNPFVGFPGFIGDAHTFNRNPNLPPGSDETLLHAEGKDVAIVPLLPEAGNVWPGPAPPEPTLADVQRLQNQQQPLFNPSPPQIGPGNPTAPVPHGTSTPSGAVQTAPAIAPPGRRGGAPTATTPQVPPDILNPSGPINTKGQPSAPGGASTSPNPNGGQNIIVPNGNGTSTVIAPDGSVRIVPSP